MDARISVICAEAMNRNKSVVSHWGKSLRSHSTNFLQESFLPGQTEEGIGAVVHRLNW